METNENPGKKYFSVKKQHLIDMMRGDEELGLYNEEIYGWFLKALQKGAKYQQEKLCNSEVIQRIRDSKSDAEARRIIRNL